MERIVDRFRVAANGSVRLQLGEVADDDLITWRAREAFMVAMWEMAPETMESLLTDRIVSALDSFMQMWFEEVQRNWETDDLELRVMQSTEHDELVVAIWRWGERWNLASVWMTEVLLHTLVEIEMEELEAAIGDPPSDWPINIPPIVLQSHVMDRLRAPGPRLLFGGKEVGDGLYWPMPVPGIEDDGRDYPCFDWNPAIETRADNEHRAVETFRQAYRAAQDARLEDAAGQFPQAAQTKRYEHFCWLVQYQVLGMSPAEIARQACVSRQTVTDAVKDTARLVGIDPLRPAGRPGRKPARSELSGNGTPPEN